MVRVYIYIYFFFFFFEKLTSTVKVLLYLVSLDFLHSNSLNDIMNGIAINSFNLNGTSLPLIWGGDAANYSAGANPDISKYCYDGAMNSYKVQGFFFFFL